MGVASKLDRLVQFQRATETDTGFGVTETWHDHGGPVWALREDVKDSERMRAAEIQASLTTRFHVRSTEFTRDIDPRDRLVSEGRTYTITGTKEAQAYGRRQLLEITCAVRIDTGTKELIPAPGGEE